jgi:hypothetical protein
LLLCVPSLGHRVENRPTELTRRNSVPLGMHPVVLVIPSYIWWQPCVENVMSIQLFDSWLVGISGNSVRMKCCYNSDSSQHLHLALF